MAPGASSGRVKNAPVRQAARAAEGAGENPDSRREIEAAPEAHGKTGVDCRTPTDGLKEGREWDQRGNHTPLTLRWDECTITTELATLTEGKSEADMTTDVLGLSLGVGVARGPTP